ncbi:MAG TPA: lysophospholipid acyltransferase family protein [Longimicrobiales bacterium]|nr:lysophospholipid acyltransferase family protein [Longimicrobiales bacterium]
MTILRTLWVWVFGAIATFGLSSAVVVGAVLGAKPRLYERIARNWGRLILWASGVTVEVQGRENLLMDRPQIIASNHQSWFDVFVIAANLPKMFRFVAKEELGRIPIFGRAWNTAGHISVNRSDRVQAIRTLEHFGELIREDNSAIVIFPEGTRSWDGKLLPFKKGAFMLALHTHIDIVPTAVIGSRAILKKGDWRIGSGRIILRFGQPIPTIGYTESNRDELIGLVRSQIDKMLEEAS